MLYEEWKSRYKNLKNFNTVLQRCPRFWPLAPPRGMNPGVYSLGISEDPPRYLSSKFDASVRSDCWDISIWKTLTQCDGNGNANANANANANVDDRGDYNSSPCTSYRRAKNDSVLLTTALLESAENDHRKYFMSNLTKECCRPGGSRTRNLQITSRRHILLSHQGRSILWRTQNTLAPTSEKDHYSKKFRNEITSVRWTLIFYRTTHLTSRSMTSSVKCNVLFITKYRWFHAELFLRSSFKSFSTYSNSLSQRSNSRITHCRCCQAW